MNAFAWALALGGAFLVGASTALFVVVTICERRQQNDE